MTTTIRASYLRLAMTCMARGDIRYYLCAVRIEPREEGGAFIVATDGHCLIAIIDEKGVCDVPVLICPDRVTAAQLPKVGSSRDTDEAKVSIEAYGSSIALKVTDKDGVPTHLQIRATTVEGNFPDWRKVVPKFADLKPGFIDPVNPTYPPRVLPALCDKHPAMQPFQAVRGGGVVYRLEAHRTVLFIVMPRREATDPAPWMKTWEQKPPTIAEAVADAQVAGTEVPA